MKWKRFRFPLAQPKPHLPVFSSTNHILPDAQRAKIYYPDDVQDCHRDNYAPDPGPKISKDFCRRDHGPPQKAPPDPNLQPRPNNSLADFQLQFQQLQQQIEDLKANWSRIQHKSTAHPPPYHNPVFFNTNSQDPSIPCDPAQNVDCAPADDVHPPAQITDVPRPTQDAATATSYPQQPHANQLTACSTSTTRPHSVQKFFSSHSPTEEPTPNLDKSPATDSPFTAVVPTLDKINGQRHFSNGATPSSWNRAPRSPATAAPLKSPTVPGWTPPLCQSQQLNLTPTRPPCSASGLTIVEKSDVKPPKRPTLKSIDPDDVALHRLRFQKYCKAVPRHNASSYLQVRLLHPTEYVDAELADQLSQHYLAPHQRTKFSDPLNKDAVADLVYGWKDYAAGEYALTAGVINPLETLCNLRIQRGRCYRNCVLNFLNKQDEILETLPNNVLVEVARRQVPRCSPRVA